MDYRELANIAVGKLRYSYSPYSRFNVAAALLTDDDKVYFGVNIENASYPAGICAERTAVSKAVSEGAQHFKANAIAGCRREHLDTPDYAEGKLGSFCPPCGICRQVLREFCDPDTFDVIQVKSPDDLHIMKLKDLLPESFGPDNL